ncbi:thiopeptide-type bacteriocin biosynthesis protein [Bacillus kwashiorkori]|uniref:thiopeptide-type bacteriocin biosynthesis protein n=1 Tax=Bacillus kwashiorkori TaxID=1522318 RepID=UPI00078161CB|nr:thiopeptide-type bacteriocin biosynthesis protein [Bacillus kwashiorkori]
MKEQWNALHIFYHDMTKYDSLILTVNDEMNRYVDLQLIEKWFFIRYWEGGPHIRLRYFPKDKDEEIRQKIEEKVRLFWKTLPIEQVLTKEDYYANHPFDGEKKSMEELPWFDNRSIKSIPYVPEIERYGGAESIKYSESIFMYSSQLVCYLLKATKPDSAKKFILALTLTKLLIEELLCFDEQEDLIQYATFYKQYWEPFVEGNRTNDLLHLFSANKNSIGKFYEALKTNQVVQSYFAKMVFELNNVRTIINDELYIHRIVASHIHMTNNRLGISPFVEYYISEYISKNYPNQAVKNEVDKLEKIARI